MELLFFALFSFLNITIFAGGSSSRRDYGRGYTASQWARYLGRDLCAESIEKFVRTAAVPGVSLADILTDPRTILKDIEKANSAPGRSKRKSSKLKNMLKQKSSVICSKVCIYYVDLLMFLIYLFKRDSIF